MSAEDDFDLAVTSKDFLDFAVTMDDQTIFFILL